VRVQQDYTDKEYVLKDILSRVAQGDRNAFETFYDLTRRRIYGIAMKILEEPELAEEATMDIYLKIWKLAGTYSPEFGEVTVWSNMIARNRSLDYLRKRRRRENVETSIENSSLPDVLNLNNPEGIVHLSQRGHFLRKAMQGLPKDARGMLVASFFQGMSHSEIASAFQQPLGTVKTKIRKALERLRVGLRNRI